MRDLDEPWEVTWGGDEHLWFTEKKGNVFRLNPETGFVKKVLTIPNVHVSRTPGLLGMVLHPDFEKEPYVYVHYNYVDATQAPRINRRGTASYIRSTVVRYRYLKETDTLINPESILPNIPGHSAHNGSRLTISEDNKLLLVIGDVADSKNAQTESTLPGKVLRMNLDGSIPEDNPIPDNYFYSMGHRNPQGLVAANGKIYSSEHGADNDDEINVIKPLNNYGWPFVEGYCDKENEITFCDRVKVTEPIYDWTPTIAPAGLDYYDHPAIPEWKDHLMLATLKGQALWMLELDERGEQIVDKKIYLQEKFGRIRDITVSSSGDIFLITSNSDWNVARYESMYDNIPETGNDRLLKISVLGDHEEDKFADLMTLTEDEEPLQMVIQYGVRGTTGGVMNYRTKCASCHLKYGEGIPDFAPPLVGTETVKDKKKLIETTLFGLSGEIEVLGKKYNEVMPGFASSLTNEELAEILNLIRIEGNGLTDSVTVEEIEIIRNSRAF
ncbi:MAG: PQQ-dependent sugar dehydrogenase [Halioglobus sp.]